MAGTTSTSTDRINIAIDGPAGAGKSTIARRVAGRLSYVYVDTGAMYRAATWYFGQRGIEPENEEMVLQMLPELVIELIPELDGQRVIINGQDATDEIRSIEVNARVSQYAQIEGLRSRLVALQRKMALRKGVVMDGRDIGTTVLPDAEVKVFMTASVEERARRRFNEMKEQDQITMEQLIQDMTRRDKLDQEREISPLRQAEDAVLLDTTYLNLEEVVDVILSMCRSFFESERMR